MKRWLHAPDPPPQDVVITADRQTHGKGQKGRLWHSDAIGGLYYTFGSRRYPIPVSECDSLVQDAALAVIRTVSRLWNIQLKMEWPNDLILADRKAGGILVETMSVAGSPMFDYAIIGVGLNVNQPDFPDLLSKTAVSLFQVSGQVYDLSALIIPLSKELADVCQRASGRHYGGS